MIDPSPRGLLLSMGFCVAVSSVAHAETWTRYQNARFGTTADIPAGWKAEPPPENGDGVQLVSPDKRASLTVSGGFIEPPSAAGLADLAEPLQGERVAYAKHGRGWAIVSGTKDDRIFYRKYVLSCGNAIWNSVSLDYPAVDKTAYDALVKHVSASLRGGRGSNAYRCK